MLLAEVSDGGGGEACTGPLDAAAAAADGRAALLRSELDGHVCAVLLGALVVAELVHEDSQRLLVLADLTSIKDCRSRSIDIPSCIKYMYEYSYENG